MKMIARRVSRVVCFVNLLQGAKGYQGVKKKTCLELFDFFSCKGMQHSPREIVRESRGGNGVGRTLMRVL